MVLRKIPDGIKMSDGCSERSNEELQKLYEGSNFISFAKVQRMCLWQLERMLRDRMWKMVVTRNPVEAIKAKDGRTYIESRECKSHGNQWLED